MSYISTITRHAEAEASNPMLIDYGFNATFGNVQLYVEHTLTGNYWFHKSATMWAKDNVRDIIYERGVWYDRQAGNALWRIPMPSRDKSYDLATEQYNRTYTVHNIHDITEHYSFAHPEAHTPYCNMGHMSNFQNIAHLPANCMELEWLMDDMAKWYE